MHSIFFNALHDNQRLERPTTLSITPGRQQQPIEAFPEEYTMPRVLTTVEIPEQTQDLKRQIGTDLDMDEYWQQSHQLPLRYKGQAQAQAAWPPFQADRPTPQASDWPNDGQAWIEELLEAHPEV